MYMTPNGRFIFTDKERKAANKVNGTNACTGSCSDCEHEDTKDADSPCVSCIDNRGKYFKKKKK